MVNCKIDWCDRPVRCIGLCAAHATRHYRGQDLNRPFEKKHMRPGEGLKTCASCNEDLPLDRFYTRYRNGKGRPSSACKECMIENNRTRMAAIRAGEYVPVPRGPYKKREHTGTTQINSDAQETK